MDNPDTFSALAQLERIRRCQEILNDFGRAASETRNLNQLLQIVCDQAARGTGIRHTKVMRSRPAVGDLLVVAGVGWKPGVVGHTKLGTDVQSASGRALQTRRAVVIEDLRNDPNYRYSPSLREHGIISVMNVPISLDGVVWGVLEVDSEVLRHFSQDDVTFLSALANILGLVIQGLGRAQQAEDAATRAQREVERQTILMRELVHRDKNDFQMIMSILIMQKSKQQAPEALRGFEHVIDRVAAISMAHDQLALRPDQATIDIAAYLKALCGNWSHRSETISIETHVDSAELTHERAVSLGLITNELVTNALKYAFPDGKGTVRVEFTVHQGTSRACLIVADDGIGMGPPRLGSSGLGLVESLARHIGGSVEREPVERGTTFRIDFLLVP